MIWFLVAWGVLAYLVIGNVIGNAFIKELYDNTETAQLKWHRRLKRYLMFPLSYIDNWNFIIGNREGPCMRDVLVLGNESGCIVRLTWLWPLFRFPPFLLAIVVIITVGIVKFFNSVNRTLNHLSTSAGQAIKTSNLSEAEKIRKFIVGQLEPKRNKIGQMMADNFKRREEHDSIVSGWEDLILRTGDDEQRAGFVRIVNEIRSDKARLEREYGELKNKANQLTRIAYKLRQGAAALDLYLRTSQVLAYDDGGRVLRESDEILAFAQESMRLVSEMSELPRNVLMVEMAIRKGSDEFADLIGDPVTITNTVSEKIVH